MSEATLESTGKGGGKVRRWSGYVCPACRLVFRVPSDHEGKGVVCPSCLRLLRLPGEGDDVPQLVVHGKEGQGGGAPEADGGRRKSGRRHRHHGGAVPDWESGGETRGGGQATGFRGIWLWAAFGVLSALVVFGGMLRYLSRSGDGTGGTEGGAETGLAPIEFQELGIDSDDPGAPRPGGDDAAREAAGDPAEVLTGAGDVARRFVAARSVEELLPLVRNRAEVEPKIRAWYREHGFGDLELRKFGVRRMILFHKWLAYVVVETSDFKTRNMVIEKTEDGFKVDWESWVAWSEMPWKEFREARPVEPKLFRVYAKQAQYYNFGFSDDAEWRCYQLDSPDGVEFIFGYVKRGSDLDKQMVNVEDKPVAMTLMIRFPENAPSDNQVLIESVVADGWAKP